MPGGDDCAVIARVSALAAGERRFGNRVSFRALACCVRRLASVFFERDCVEEAFSERVVVEALDQGHGRQSKEIDYGSVRRTRLVGERPTSSVTFLNSGNSFPSCQMYRNSSE